MTAKCTLFLAALPAVLAGPVRVARVGELDGQVEVQLHSYDAWRPAARNLPLVERSWVRSAAGARVELELDEGSALRMAGDAICELSDYTRLSTGQRITTLSVDHGVAYFTGETDGRDSLILAVPGAQATVRAGTRIRLEVNESASQIAVIEGRVRFSSPGAELDVNEGQTARIENGAQPHFVLRRELTPVDTDGWSEQRDQVLAASTSAGHVPDLFFGLVDLDGSGSWLQTEDLGTVWKPKMNAIWTPYQDGQWIWYDELGYTWIANETWGWLPFHYGRWMRTANLGWVWTPGKAAYFHPGAVYWLREANIVGWGPLGPGETWSAASLPKLYSKHNTTLARFSQDARVIRPVDAAEKVSTTAAVFVIAPPSPAWDSARFDAVRPVLRAGSTRIVPVLPGVTYEGGEAAPEAPPVPDLPPLPQEQFVAADAPAAPAAPVPEPGDMSSPAPIYTGIIVVNPTDKTAGNGRTSVSRPTHPHLPAPREEPPPRHEPTPRPRPKDADEPKSSDPKPSGQHSKPAGGFAQQWKDRAEYDLYAAIMNEHDAARRLPLLTSWKDKYSASDITQARNDLFIQAYAAMRKPELVLVTGKEALRADPLDFTAMYLIAANVQLLAKPTEDELWEGEGAAAQMLGNLDRLFDRSQKPANASEESWAQARTQAEALAHTAIGWIALHRRDYAVARSEFRQVLRIAPHASSAGGWPINSRQVTAWLEAATARSPIQTAGYRSSQ